MKKLISLLLVLVLTLGMLAGISMAADKPVEATEADAGVKVTFAGASDAYYFENLTQDLIAWACLEMPGAPTFTVLKDLELINVKEGGSRFLEIPQNNASWYGSKAPNSGGKLPVTFDLNGKTISYTGTANLMNFTRWGAIWKNGTILHNSERPIFVFGTTEAQVANSSATSVYAPELVLENLNALQIGEKGAPVINSYLYSNKITATNSVLWSTNSRTALFGQSTQAVENITLYEGEFAPSLTLKNSVAGAGGTVYPFDGEEGSVVEAEDSVLVTNHSTGLLAKESSTINLDFSKDTVKEGWQLNVGGQTLTGKAYVVGNDPFDVKLPFTDVKEGDWFYAFVKELYGKKIIAGQTADTFNPNGNLTYAAALKLLVVGLTGKDAGNSTSGHWATNYLNEATTAGWTAIGADKLDTPITREAFCEIAAKAKNLTEKAENPFKDTNNDAVLALVKAGVISGMSADTFAPEGILTRAQISKIISLLLKL